MKELTERARITRLFQQGMGEKSEVPRPSAGLRRWIVS